MFAYIAQWYGHLECNTFMVSEREQFERVLRVFRITYALRYVMCSARQHRHMYIMYNRKIPL